MPKFLQREGSECSTHDNRTKGKGPPRINATGLRPCPSVWRGYSARHSFYELLLLTDGLAGTRIQKQKPSTLIILVLAEVEHLRDGVCDGVE
jgi:hypothetical protein